MMYSVAQLTAGPVLPVVLSTHSFVVATSFAGYGFVPPVVGLNAGSTLLVMRERSGVQRQSWDLLREAGIEVEVQMSSLEWQRERLNHH